MLKFAKQELSRTGKQQGHLVHWPWGTQPFRAATDPDWKICRLEAGASHTLLLAPEAPLVFPREEAVVKAVPVKLSAVPAVPSGTVDEMGVQPAGDRTREASVQL